MEYFRLFQLESRVVTKPNKRPLGPFEGSRFNNLPWYRGQIRNGRDPRLVTVQACSRFVTRRRKLRSRHAISNVRRVKIRVAHLLNATYTETRYALGTGPIVCPPRDANGLAFKREEIKGVPAQNFRNSKAFCFCDVIRRSLSISFVSRVTNLVETFAAARSGLALTAVFIRLT